jgi:hypothetical protein
MDNYLLLQETSEGSSQYLSAFVLRRLHGRHKRSAQKINRSTPEIQYLLNGQVPIHASTTDCHSHKPKVLELTPAI